MSGTGSTRWLDAVYTEFVAKAADGRRMPVQRMGELARGRVWTGADAAANGLVDEIGGLRTAAEIARRRAGLPADAPLRIYPRLHPARPAAAARFQRVTRRRRGRAAFRPVRRYAAGAPPGASRPGPASRRTDR